MLLHNIYIYGVYKIKSINHGSVCPVTACYTLNGVSQETFDAGLQAFEKEGIQTITTLKDQLVSSNHAQTAAIEKRYQDVIAR